MPQTYEIPYSKLETILKRRRRIAKRNANNGLPVPVVNVIERSFRKEIVRDALGKMRGGDSNTRTVRVASVKIEVDGFTAEVGDWQLLGYRWSHSIGTRDGVRRFVGSSPTVPREISHRDGLHCDHCQAQRERLSSYVVTRTDGTGHPVEVGATCMSSFMGNGVSAGVLSGLANNAMLIEEIARIAGENFLASVDDIADEVDTVLAVAVSVIARDGFVSAKEAYAGHPATWIKVYDDVRRYRVPDLDESDLGVTFADFMEASSIIEWLKTVVAAGDANPFVMKAKEVLDFGISNVQDVAVLTALVGAHRRHLAEEDKRARSTDITHQSRHVGITGERSNFVCAVRSIRPYQNRFGEGDVVTMTDGGDNVLIWFASGRSHGLEVGHSYELTATVRVHEHSERGQFSGAAQTVVNRVKVIQDFGQTVERKAPTVEQEQENREFDEIIGYLAMPGR